MQMKALEFGVIFFVAMILLIMPMVLNLSSKVKKFDFFFPSPYEVRYGMWVNTTYSGKRWWPQKLVNQPWGSHEWYMNTTDTIISTNGSAILMGKWQGSKGEVWYKAYIREDWTDREMFKLEKISKNGTVFETVWSIGDFPKEENLNPNTENYRIYYRQ
jgi:hypothetical protein